MTQSDIGIIEKLKRKTPMFPATGGGGIGKDVSGKVTVTSYVTDDGLRLVNPDGPEAAAIITEMVEALERDRKALEAMMNTWLDYHDSHSLTQPVTGASNNAFEDALAARDAIDTLLAKVSGK